MDQQIRVTLKISREFCKELYDDLAALGPRYRAFHIRSIALAYYQARGSPQASSRTADDQPTLPATSADSAIIDAFGGSLGMRSKD